jgi:hypothetical protein
MEKNMSGNGLAPSEKHLEDYLWEHPEALDLWGWADTVSSPFFEPLWRQISLPSGKPDLIGRWEGLSIGIIELKVGPIDTRAFAQLMKYIRDIKQIVFNAQSEYWTNRLPYREFMALNPLTDGEWSDNLIRGVLIGSSIPDKQLLMACEACHVEVFTYHYDDGYEFEEDNSEKQHSNERWHALKSGVCRDIEQEIIDMLGGWLETEYDAAIRFHNQRFNAAEVAAEFISQFKVPGGVP